MKHHPSCYCAQCRLASKGQTAYQEVWMPYNIAIAERVGTQINGQAIFTGLYATFDYTYNIKSIICIN